MQFYLSSKSCVIIKGCYYKVKQNVVKESIKCYKCDSCFKVQKFEKYAMAKCLRYCIVWNDIIVKSLRFYQQQRLLQSYRSFFSANCKSETCAKGLPFYKIFQKNCFVE